jgi:hypothetical protein
MWGLYGLSFGCRVDAVIRSANTIVSNANDYLPPELCAEVCPSRAQRELDCVSLRFLEHAWICVMGRGPSTPQPLHFVKWLLCSG